MTYKDHGKVAEIFKANLEAALDEENEDAYVAISGVVDDFCAYALADNPRFNRDQFMIATGIGLV